MAAGFRAWRHLLIVGLAVIGSGACDRTSSASIPDDAAERYAAVFCATEQACGCEVYASQAQCEAEVAAAFNRAAETATVFDESCFEAALSNRAFLECSNAQTVNVGCVAMSGSGEVGDSCSADPRLSLVRPRSSCREDLRCSTGTDTCRIGPSEQQTKAAGDACVRHHLATCGLEMYCDQSSRCRPSLARGEGCDDPLSCKPSSYCQGASGTCVALVELGQPCDPSDLSPCAFAESEQAGVSLESTWCNPATQRCEIDDPYVCTVLEAPLPL